MTPQLPAMMSGVLDGLHEGCQVIGFDWRFLYVNDAVVAQKQTPREALLGRTLMETCPGVEDTKMFAALDRCMRDRQQLKMDQELPLGDGTKGWFELRFVPVPEGTCVLSRDVTDTRRTAHDVNNTLSVILSLASLLVEELATDDPMREDLEEIMMAGMRAAELTRRLLPQSSRRA